MEWALAWLVAVLLVAWCGIIYLTLSDLEGELMALLDALKAQVAENSSVIESALALIQGIAGRLDEALADDDPDALQALVDELKAKDEALAAAVAANTVAAPPPPVAPPA